MRAIACIDRSAHKAAEGFYNWSDVEPIAFGGTVIDLMQISYTYAVNGLTFFDVVKQMGSSLGSGEGVVIVGHGNDHALLLPLVRKTTQKLTRSTVTTLINFMSGADKRSATQVAASSDVRIKSKTTFLEMCDWIDIIRERNLGHVALRACNLGKTGVGFLQELKTLFNCQMVSGPMIKDAYVDWNPNNVARSIQDFERVINDPLYRKMIVWGQTPNRVAIQTTQTKAQAEDHSFSMESLAESSTAIQTFLDDMFPTTKHFQYRPGQTVPIHGFYYEGAVVFPNTHYYSQLLCTAPSYQVIPLPMYFPPEEVKRQGIISRIRSNVQVRRAARKS